VTLAAFTLAGGLTLSLPRRRQLGDSGCLFELGNRTEHLANQNGSGRILEEEIRR
jgi:hypothetical protein